MPNAHFEWIHIAGHGNAEPQGGEELFVSAELVNDGDDDLGEVTVVLSCGDHTHQEAAHVGPHGRHTFAGSVGVVAAGGYDLSAVAYAELEDSSGEIARTGVSQLIHAPEQHHDPQPHPEEAPYAAAPSGRIHAIAVQPHSNVEHAAGTAWSNEPLRISVQVENDGTTAVHDGQVTVQAGTQTLQVAANPAPGTADWYAVEATALEAGNHEIQAWWTGEANDQSHNLAHHTEPLTVTDPPSTGWIQGNVQFRVIDFMGRPLRGYRLFTQFKGMDGQDAYGGEQVEASRMEGGVQTCAGIRFPSEGTLSVMFVSEDEPGPVLEGLRGYQLAEGTTNVSFDVLQGHEELTLSATDANGVADQLSAKISGGLKFEVVSVGGEVATSETRSRTYTQAVSWKVRVATEALTITQAGH